MYKKTKNWKNKKNWKYLVLKLLKKWDFIPTHSIAINVLIMGPLRFFKNKTK